MFYLLITYLKRSGVSVGGFGVLHYITFRAALALIAAFVTGILIGPGIIRKLHKLKVGQRILKITKKDGVDLYAMHHKKQGTPTMGGIVILIAFIMPVILFCNLTNPLILMLVAMTVGFGLVGYRDDYLKLTKKNSKGLPARVKLLCQLGLGFIVGAFLVLKGQGIIYSLTSQTGGAHICFPFFKHWYPDLGLLFIPYAMLVVTAASNAVNLTDGLDGLAIGTVIVVAASYALIAYLVGRPDFSRYLIIPYVPGGGEIAIFLAAVIGAAASFLWFNAHPAQVFMGDIGSLTLGGLIGTIALLLKQEVLLILIGGIFVIEALSVIIQVTSYKLRKKRVFLMSPLHHHFEKLGLAESKIIARFWIVATILALAGLTTLKLR